MATKDKRLDPKQVMSLVFEGGGGKGFAYCGALSTLERIGLLKFNSSNHRVSGNVKAFAGSSAGAITAMLLSCGYQSSEIEALLQKNYFGKLFDVPKPYRVLAVAPPAAPPGAVAPKLYGCSVYVSDTGDDATKKPEPKETANQGDKLLDMLLPTPLSKALAGASLVLDIPQAELITVNIISVLTSLACIGFVLIPALKAGSSVQPPVISLITQNTITTATCLLTDMGIFCGDGFYNAFDLLMSRAAYAKGEITDFSFLEKTKEVNLPVSFEEHYGIFGTKLGITATDFSSHKSIFFNKDTTPNMSVALAVRASMGIPILFKPIILGADTAFAYAGEPFRKNEERVMYVDGGLFNNVPLSAVDESWGIPGIQTTLALRLADEEPTDIDSLPSLLKSWFIDTGILGSGESQIHNTLKTDARTILLKTDGLSLLDFAAPSEQLKTELEEKNCNRICEYFNLPPDKYKKPSNK